MENYTLNIIVALGIMVCDFASIYRIIKNEYINYDGNLTTKCGLIRELCTRAFIINLKKTDAIEIIYKCLNMIYLLTVIVRAIIEIYFLGFIDIKFSLFVRLLWIGGIGLFIPMISYYFKKIALHFKNKR